MPVLLVEDDHDVRQALKDTLEYLGYDVLDAAHGSQALSLLQEQPGPVELVISDLVMPGMNALELYEALQGLQQDVKLLIVTGYPMPHAGEVLAKRPGVNWTAKPISLERLEAMVSAMIRGQP